MKSKLVFTLIAWSMTASCYALVEEHTAKRLDGSDITFYVQKPSRSGSFPFLLILQGSDCRSVYNSLGTTAGALDAAGIARLDVEKYSLTKSTDLEICPESYLQHNSIDQRVQDILRVISTLRSSEPNWNRDLLIIGGSEGAIVAAIIAALVPETRKLALLASGGGITMREDLLILREQELRSQGSSNEEIAATLDSIRNTMNEIVANPTPTKTWYGDTNTYFWWRSILDLLPLNYLTTLTIPVYIAQGDADRATSIEGSRRTAQMFLDLGKTNLIYREYPGLDHHWDDTQGVNHGPEVIGELFQWVLVR